MTTITAETVLRSRNTADPSKVISTLLLRYPRCIHTEFMTHRALSKNAASSRAIPINKLIDDVLADPFRPLWWGKAEPGMAASTELEGSDLKHARAGWDGALESAIAYARWLRDCGAHKQLVNRILEPFAHITVVATGTQWSNLLALRDHPAAEPHFQILAKAIRVCLETAPIQDLAPGEAHLPFVTEEDRASGDHGTPELIKLSVARCASTSYKTVDGFDMTLARGIELHDKLVAARPMHASPAEHQAFADHLIPGEEGPYGEWRREHWSVPYRSGNLGPGWIQYRKTLAGECQ